MGRASRVDTIELNSDSSNEWHIMQCAVTKSFWNDIPPEVIKDLE